MTTPSSEPHTQHVRNYYEIDDRSAAATLRTIRRHGRGIRILLRGGTVVTMDPAVGDFTPGDVLIENGSILAVGQHLDTDSAIVVDVGSTIVMPGLVDSHRHAWQAAFRRLIVDADLDAYVATTHGGMALNYRPEDMYIGTLSSSLSAIESGITTVLDFSHNSRSGAHNDAVLRAYRDSGIRAVHAAAAPNAGQWDQQWPEDLVRLREEHCGDGHGRLTIRMGVDMHRVRPLTELLAFARHHGFGITVDGVHGVASSTELLDLAAAGLLAPDITVIHANDMSASTWAALAVNGVGVTLAPTSDQQIGIADALPPIQAALDHSIRPSLSVDVEISLAGDLFTQMRAVLSTQRMNVSRRRYSGETSLPRLITNRNVLEFATVQGASDVGLARTTGSLTPGKAADIVVLRAEDIDNMPLNNAVGTIVQGVDSRHVDMVMIDGEVRKWRGKNTFEDVSGLRTELRASRDYLAAKAGWTPHPLRPPGNTDVKVDSLRRYLDARRTD